MKGKLTKLQLTAIIGCAIIVVLGGCGYYYVWTLLDAAQKDLNAKIGLRDRLVHSPVFPSDTSFKVLNENNSLLASSIQALSARLSTPDNKLKTVTQKNTIDFKQELAQEDKKLTDLAKKLNVEVPPEFHFGFARYYSTNPRDKDTVFLGKQLIAIDELVTQLLQSRISKLLAVRRTFDEVNGGRIDSTISDPSNEMLRAKVLHVGKGIYDVMPFEIEFLGKPTALRTFMNNLTASPYIFVIRSIQVESTKLDPITLDELSRESTAAQPQTDNGQATAPSDAPKPPMHAMGFEDIHVVMRVDLIEWFGHPRSNGKPGLK